MNTTKTNRPGFWLRAIQFRKHQLGREQRRAFRDELADKARTDISDEDYATTMATLEKMARNLGWDDDQELPGRFGRRHGFGSGHGHGFGRGHDHGHGHHDHPGRPFGPRGFRKPFRDEDPEA